MTSPRLSGLALALFLSAGSGAAMAEVFINEIHYDNVDADVGEAIEVVATAGEDLTQYRIVLYNGANGAQYDDDPVPLGSLVACGAQVRFATINYPLNGLQNGSPDGMALVGPGDAVLQFLSYEGTFVAVGGPADGMLSTDIGVEEGGSTPIGHSLQLSGTGSTYDDFVWQNAAANTFNACNNGQVFTSPVDNPPSVVSTNPADAAIDVPVASLITVSFSESIVVDNAAGITLDCGAGSLSVATGANANVLTITPAADLPFGASCAVALAADSVADIDGDPDPMEAAFGFSFDTVVDNPPTLLSSTPADGANDFPANANLQLEFSESVTLGASWFDITCSVSGARGPDDVVSSGGPSDYTLNPDTDFEQGESCLLTLNSAQITDLDGNPDALTGPNTIAFTPAAPLVNQPPLVLSTTPIEGDDNFPPAGNLVVLFSELVTVSPGAFTLVCDTSTGIVLSHASSGTSFSIDTGTALVSEDGCTFTIVASLIEDVEGANPAADVVVQFTVASSSVGDYYDQVNTSSPEQLRCSLHATIRDHVKYPYTAATTDTWDILNLADEDPVDTSKILDVYKNASYTKISGGQGVYNREHTWPRTFGLGDTGTPGPATDTHMLHLTDTDYNTARLSRIFADCPGCTELPTLANHGVGGSGGGDSNYSGGPDGNAGSFEVWDHLKGNMARAAFYMVIRYEGGAGEPDLELTDTRALITSAGSGGKHYMGLLTTLLAWHQQDPPDARELERNQIVFSFQGNRNPFVDHPEWATLALFESSQPAECELAGGDNTAPVAVDDSYDATEDMVLNVLAAQGVLVNDTDADNDTLTAQLIANATNGVVALAADGGFSYTPEQDYCGADAFTYRASDGQVPSNVATVTLNVVCVTAPVAVDDSYDATEDMVLNVLAAQGVLVNDTDADSGTLTAQLIANATNGVVALAADGGFSYAPEQDYCGGDEFTYRASDGQALSNLATVTLAVACVNDAPVAVADSYQANEDSVLVVNAVDGVLANDFDVDNDPLTALLIANAINGSVSLDADGSFTYTPNADACGSDSFIYRAFDGQAQSDDALVEIKVACVNDAPVAVADSYQAIEDTVLVVDAVDGVLANDFDVDNDTLTAVLIANAINGSVSLDADGGFTYTPNADACGTDSFIYRAFDGQAQSDDALVEIEVACVNDAPVPVGSLPDRTATEGIAITPFATDSAFNDVDVGDVLTYSISGQPQGIVIDPVSGEVSGTPVIGSATGSPYAVTITAEDLAGASATQQFTYTVLDPSDFIFADGFED